MLNKSDVPMTNYDAERIHLQQSTPSTYGTSTTANISPVFDGEDKEPNKAENKGVFPEKDATKQLDKGANCDDVSERGCRRPYLVEMPMFLYFLAYKACLPLQVRIYLIM